MNANQLIVEVETGSLFGELKHAHIQIHTK